MKNVTLLRVAFFNIRTQQHTKNDLGTYLSQDKPPIPGDCMADF